MFRPHYILFSFALILLCGCTSSVHLIAPFPDQKLTIAGGEAPKFTWEIPEFPGEAIYHLEIATDISFEDMVLSAKGLESRFLQPEKEDVFFPGDTDYYWRVTGSCLNRYGKVVRTFPCFESRSFYIEKRPTVRILFKIPPPDEGGTVKICIRDEEFEKDFTRDMEVGEWIKLTAFLTKGDDVKEIGGKLRVHTSNETTAFGNIIVDSLTQEKMEEIVQGKVGDFYYTLGGEKIVTLTLGSRTESKDTGIE
jgi:hypothetical protein